MTPSSELLESAREHIGFIQKSLQDTQVSLTAQYIKMAEQYKKAEGSERITLSTLLQYTQKRQLELSALEPSPYFSRCDISSEEKNMNIYIGKFSYPEESVVSWISPISTLRFAHPGKANYTTPDRAQKEVILTRKDEYMIKDSKIMFFATETREAARTLIYQEHFSNRKTGFILPEIIARMEEAQDKVIRSSWRGPLVISGPAGSGKTTLALHRVAYLMQVPEVRDNFPGHRIRVFVQDQGTKSYFSALLPDLGIDNVEITTFQDWAYDILGLSQGKQIVKLQEEYIEDTITLQKIEILHGVRGPLEGKPIEWLKSLYKNNFHTQLDIVLERIDNTTLDDIDLTLLLHAYKKAHGSLHESREYLVQQKNSYEVKRKIGRFAVSYNLCVVDEFQNYLPEQLQLIRGCMNDETQSLVYVGDMRQQTRFGTIQSWQQIGESIDDSRSIILEKVYRNTKAILRYIQSVGYDIAIPEALPEGIPVETLPNTRETQEYICSLALAKNDRLIGILAKDFDILAPYQHLKSEKHIKVLTVREAQGVEFDTVFFVGNAPATWHLDTTSYPLEIQQEKQRINKDLLYVGLTRAMQELYVVGDIV